MPTGMLFGTQRLLILLELSKLMPTWGSKAVNFFVCLFSSELEKVIQTLLSPDFLNFPF